MTDDVKAAVEWLRRLVRDGFSASGAHLLAHIDGEQARQDAAVAAAREEQQTTGIRAVHAALAERFAREPLTAVEAINLCPSLTATPLADRIAELENYFAHARDLALEFDRRLLVEIGEHAETTAELLDTQTRAEKAEAERDALMTRCEALTAHHATERDGWIARGDALRAQVLSLKADHDFEYRVAEELRAQVEAARANCQEILGNRREAMQARSAVGQVLAAMDGAKPK